MMRTYIKRFTVFLLAVLMVCSVFPAVTASAEDINHVEQAQYGIVRVVCIANEDMWVTGTGFAVGKLDEDAKYFMTNNHVVDMNVDEVYITITDADDLIKATVLTRDEEKDLALLELSEALPERKPLPLLPSDQLKKSQDVYCLGFPGVADDVSDRGAMLGSGVEDITITKGSVSNSDYSVGGVGCILTDASVNHGNSGGPMIDELGYVVGINTLKISEGLNVAVDIDYAMDMLDEHGIEYFKGEAGISAEDILLRLAEAAIEETAVAAKRQLTKIIVIAVAALVVVAGAIVTIIIISKKKRKARAGSYVEKDAVTVSMTTEMTAKRTLVVLCETGPIAGRMTSSATDVIIGRDPSRCQMVFPSGTPGVSKVHCSVMLRAGTIVLTDLGSSNGTYLANGTRLEVNRPVSLNDGDRFYLGSKSVCIAVGLQD